MSNLGGYQRITTWSKKIGGPGRLFGAAVGSGILIGVVTEKLISNINSKKSKDKGITEVNETFRITTAGVDNTGLEFKVGDSFRVIQIDKDVVLIEKIKDENNPYYVSNELLTNLSLPYSQYLKNYRSRDK